MVPAVITIGVVSLLAAQNVLTLPSVITEVGDSGDGSDVSSVGVVIVVVAVVIGRGDGGVTYGGDGGDGRDGCVVGIVVGGGGMVKIMVV